MVKLRSFPHAYVLLAPPNKSPVVIDIEASDNGLREYVGSPYISERLMGNLWVAYNGDSNLPPNRTIHTINGAKLIHGPLVAYRAKDSTMVNLEPDDENTLQILIH